MSKTILLGIVVSFTLLILAPAWGSGYIDTYGLSNRSIALGGAFTAVADDYSATFYNPAGLGQLQGPQVVMEFQYARPEIEIKKLNGEDLIIYDTTGQVRTNPTKGTGMHGLDLTIPVLGIVLDVNRIVNIPVNAKVGIIASLPERYDTGNRIRSMPPDQPQMLRYGDDIDHMFLSFGAGIEAVKNFAYVGGGVQGILTAPTTFIIDGVSLTNQNVESQAQLGNVLQWKPIVGLLVTPWDKRMRIGLSWKASQQLEIGPASVSAMVRAGGMTVTVPLQIDIKAFYTPEEYSTGLAFDLDSFLISLEVDKQLWSKYKFSDIDSLHYFGNPDFKDTYNYRIGLEYKPEPKLSLLMGYFHQPSPVPDQSGRVTNYIDMDKDCFSLGAEYTFDSIPGWTKGPLKVGGSCQYQRLKGLTVDKAGVTGFTWVDQESYTVKGYAWNIGGSLSLLWK